MTSSTGPVGIDNANDEDRDLTECPSPVDSRDEPSQEATASLETVATDGHPFLGLRDCCLVSLEANELTLAG